MFTAAFIYIADDDRRMVAETYGFSKNFDWCTAKQNFDTRHPSHTELYKKVCMFCITFQPCVSYKLAMVENAWDIVGTKSWLHYYHPTEELQSLFLPPPQEYQ